MYDFTDKVVVVTGASRGIGLQTVKEFAKRGAKVVMVSSNQERINNAVAAVKDGHDHVFGFCCDLSRREEIKRLFDFVIDKFSTIDILVNNVGAYSEKAPWNEIDEDLWHKSFDLNTLSHYYTVKYFGEFMIDNKINGNIVCVGSSTALQYKRGKLHYTVSKSALHTMVQVLALDLAKHGIRINVVSPGPTMTETVKAWMDDPKQAAAEAERLKKIPLGRYASTKDIANGIMFLASDDASFITGAILPIDGGYTIGETY